jgi:hypothetical protein
MVVVIDPMYELECEVLFYFASCRKLGLLAGKRERRSGREMRLEGVVGDSGPGH